MSDKTGIEWTDATWNPVTGCTKVSPGCDHCYAETFAERFRGVPGHHFEQGFDVVLRPERLDIPVRWTKPRRIFVNSMSDLFHDAVPDEFIARVWQVMASTPQHTYQVLTKRHGRMRAWLNRCATSPGGWITHDGTDPAGAYDGTGVIVGYPEPPEHLRGPVTGRRGGKPRYKASPPAYGWPLPNVWVGVSVEDQKRADLRIPALLDTPAAVRFLSCEPLLGPVDMHGYEDGVDWVIVGGESGRGARPMQLDWARSLRDQCAEAGVPFLFKQWGEWAPTESLSVGHLSDSREWHGEVVEDGVHPQIEWRRLYRRVGKKAAGRELDGRTWDEYPVRETVGAA